MSARLIQIMIRRFIYFIIFYSKKWLFLGYLFVLIYVTGIKIMYPTIKLDGQALLTMLFPNTYPIVDFTDFLVPYFWMFIHFLSLLVIFSSLVDFIEKQSIYLLIKVKERRLLALSIIASISLASVFYIFGLFVLFSLVLMQESLFSYIVFKYFILLCFTIILANFLALLIYLVTSNSIISLFASSLILTLASMSNYFFTPFKTSLILNNQIELYLNGETYVKVLALNICLLLLMGAGILNRTKKLEF